MTTNREYCDKFDQLNGTQIDKLFWIAGSIENSDLEDFLQDEMDNNDWNQLFPQLGPAENEGFNDYLEDKELVQLLIEYEKYGLIAQITIPECYNFRYKEGKLTGWSCHPGIRRIKYIYAETIPELYSEIERVQAAVFEEFKENDEQKQSKLS